MLALMGAVPMNADPTPIVEPDGPNLELRAALVDLVQGLFLVSPTLLTPRTSYADIAGWDSLSHINVIFGIEQRFGIRFDDHELDELRQSSTLGELESIVRRKLTPGVPIKA
jgi:acyl carrier protein